ncbi:cupin domain-containing protein [Pontibacter mucosus]|uniref:cupin domain-containing protein n=1 Tax=Pontibacter mucosus TaxID=1649266 RepID=UPI001475DE12|nr:cupin domain-containing protein [Pontibacter mucosus]
MAAQIRYRKMGWTETGLHGDDENKFEMTGEAWLEQKRGAYSWKAAIQQLTLYKCKPLPEDLDPHSQVAVSKYVNNKSKIMRLDCTELGMVMTIVKSSRDTNGESLEMEWILSPHSGETPIHIHPTAIETYEILSGELEVFKKDKWITARVGEKITIESGEPHTFKNTTDEFVRVYNTHQPAMEFENFFKGLHKFAKSGLVKNGKMNFKSIVGISTLWTNYSKEIVSVKPPAFLMRVLGIYGKMIGLNFK